MDGLGYPLHSGHPSNRTAADSLVCLTGLTIAEWNNLKKAMLVKNDVITLEWGQFVYTINLSTFNIPEYCRVFLVALIVH